MGTSSSRKGRTSKNIPQNIENVEKDYWRSAKIRATKYIQGDGSFGGAMQSLIHAMNGTESFFSTSRKKKRTGLITLINVFSDALQIGLRGALEKKGYVDEDKAIDELLINYVSEKIYPDNTTYEDTSNREELLNTAYSFLQYFDEEGNRKIKNELFNDVIIEIIDEDIATSILDEFKDELPLSLETNNPNKTKQKLSDAKKDIKEKIQKHKVGVSININIKESIDNYIETITNLVLDDYKRNGK